MAKVSKFFENWRKMSPQPATVISNSFELQDGEGNIQVVCDNGGFQTDETQQRNVTNKLQERKKSRIGGRDLKQNLGEKLNRIKFIHDKRRQICDYAFALAMLGVALMIFEAEMLETRAYSLNSNGSIVVRTIICISTLILLTLIIRFYWFDVQLFLTTNGLHDWTLALTWTRTLKLIVELIVCGVCITPGNFYPLWESPSCAKDTRCPPNSADLLLGIPMFFRFYLGARVMLMHSKMFTQPSRRVIGSVNRINFKFSFYIKTLIYDSPLSAMIVVSVSFWLSSSWIMLICERFMSSPTDGIVSNSYANSMWLTAITFLTVGYGDVTPKTYCGRAVAIIVGLMGTTINSLLVAIIARKLQLTSTERNIHDFMIGADLHMEAKMAAANIIRETWLVFRAQGAHKTTVLRRHRRKFLEAIRRFRAVKQSIRERADEDYSQQTNKGNNSGMERVTSTLVSMEVNFTNRLNQIESQLAELSVNIQTVLTAHSHDKHFED